MGNVWTWLKGLVALAAFAALCGLFWYARVGLVSSDREKRTRADFEALVTSQEKHLDTEAKQIETKQELMAPVKKAKLLVERNRDEKSDCVTSDADLARLRNLVQVSNAAITRAKRMP